MTVNAINIHKVKLKKKTWIIAGLAFLAILSVFLVLKAVNDRKAPQKLLKVMAENIDLQVKNVVYTDVGQSGEKWEIKADTVQYLKKENVALFDKVRVRMMTAEGKSFTLTGDKGRFQTEKKDIEIVGNVEGTSDGGERFTTDKLNYNNAEGKIYTNSAVTMASGQMKIVGTGLTVNLKSGELTLVSKVKAEIKSK
jgi:LPS export ABC transporter protein LptC